MRTTVLGSVAIAALFVLTTLVGVHVYSGPDKPSTASHSPLDLTPNADNAALSLLGITPQQVTSATNWWSGLTNSQQQEVLAAYRQIPLTHQFPVALAHQLGLVQAQYLNLCNAAVVAVSAGAGAAIGNVPGAIIGATAGALLANWACNDASQLQALFNVWSQALITSYAAEGNLTQAEYSNIISALNLTKPAWERAADHAALLQLGNSSFNTSLDLMQSGIFANLAPVWSSFTLQEAGILNALLPPINAKCATGGVFASLNCALNVNSGGGNLGPSTSQGGIVGYGALFDANGGSPSATNVWIPNGANISTRAGDSLTIKNLLNGLFYNYVPVVGCPGVNTGWCSELFPGPSGLYTVTDTVGLTFWIANGQVAPSTSTSLFDCSGTALYNGCVGSTQSTDDGFAVFEPNTVYTGCTGPDMRGTAGRSTVSAGSTVCETGNIAIVGTGAYAYTTNNLNNNQWKSLQPQLSAIEWDAVQNAQTYWQFLRAIGYTSISQIPPNCIVPAPYLVLPSNLQNVALSVSQWMSLYLATLQGMATFYNTSLNSANFCGTQSTHQFKIGSEIWGNLFVNATGFVYLNNGTSPINVQGQALPTESFKNTSTWAVGATTPCSIGFVVSNPGNISANTCTGAEQLFLMPTLGTVSIPVGVKWAVPANNPVQIYAIQAGVEFLATGNGTGTGTCTTGQGGFCPQDQVRPSAALPPGASIFLTSCTVGGSASNNCTVTVQTLNITVAKIGCVGCSTPGLGGEFGFGNPFQALAALFCSIPLLGLICGGGTGIATLVIEAIFAILVVLAIIALLAYGGRRAIGAGSKR